MVDFNANDEWPQLTGPQSTGLCFGGNAGVTIKAATETKNSSRG